MPDPALSLTGVSAGYVPDLPILKDINLHIPRAQVTLIIGPNGAGKSTLIKAIAGLVPVQAGRISRAGHDITHMRPDQMARHGIAYVPQNDNIFRSLTIRQNLELALRRAGSQGPARMVELFTQFPALDQKQSEKAGALSGGQRQFLAVAMALAVKPDLILLDEPSAGLAPKAAQEVLALARRLTEIGVTVLLVEQNVSHALPMADTCIILAEGRVQHEGRAADLQENSMIADIYMGGRRKKVAQ